MRYPLELRVWTIRTENITVLWWCRRRVDWTRLHFNSLTRLMGSRTLDLDYASAEAHNSMRTALFSMHNRHARPRGWHNILIRGLNGFHSCSVDNNIMCCGAWLAIALLSILINDALDITQFMYEGHGDIERAWMLVRTDWTERIYIIWCSMVPNWWCLLFGCGI